MPRVKYTIEMIQEMVSTCTKGNYTLISTIYPNELGVVEVKCNDCGTIAQKKPKSLTPGSELGCGQCYKNNKKYTIDDIRELIKSCEKGSYTLMSTTFPNELGRVVSVKCNECGTIAQKNIKSLTPGSENGCWECYRINKVYTIEEIQELVDQCVKSDYTLISNSYPNEHGRVVELECNICGTVTKKPVHDLLPESETGCLTCHYNSIGYTIEKIQDLIKNSKKLDLTLLSKSYPNELGNMIRVKCNICSRIYKMNPSRLREGHERYCKKCSDDRFKLPIEEVKQRLATYEFELLSDAYINSHTKLDIQCKRGHKFRKSISAIKQYPICPDCKPGAPGTSEEVCRMIIESLLGKKFPKVSPSWLTNKNGNRMTFDGYCEELNIAFEYNGKQHYIYVEHFHKTYENFISRCRMDKEKQDKCDDKGVRLVVIPYNVPKENIQTFIHIELSRLGVDVPDYDEIDLNKNFRNVYVDERNAIIDSALTDTKFERIGNYITAKENITVQCKDCGNESGKKYYQLLHGKNSVCKHCNFIKN